MAQMTNYQVFPVTKDSHKGPATDVWPKKYKLVLAEVAGDITFTFDDQTTLVILAAAGQVFTVDIDCVSISSAASVVLS